MRKEVLNISLGTVYRNLKMLWDSGEIMGIDLCGTFCRFDGNTDNHYHFRCEGCGCVFDMNEPGDDEIGKRISLKTGLKITSHRLEVRGLCRECQGINLEVNSIGGD